jgi:hypothetical protein
MAVFLRLAIVDITTVWTLISVLARTSPPIDDIPDSRDVGSPVLGGEEWLPILIIDYVWTIVIEPVVE